MAVAAVASQAQTLNVVMGSVTYQFPAMQMGEMAYMGSTVSILGRTFVLGDITKMYIDASAVTDNQIGRAHV